MSETKDTSAEETAKYAYERFIGDSKIFWKAILERQRQPLSERVIEILHKFYEQCNLTDYTALSIAAVYSIAGRRSEADEWNSARKLLNLIGNYKPSLILKALDEAQL